MLESPYQVLLPRPLLRLLKHQWDFFSPAPNLAVLLHLNQIVEKNCIYVICILKRILHTSISFWGIAAISSKSPLMAMNGLSWLVVRNKSRHQRRIQQLVRCNALLAMSFFKKTSIKSTNPTRKKIMLAKIWYTHNSPSGGGFGNGKAN
jgi:hypothetical protein